MDEKRRIDSDKSERATQPTTPNKMIFESELWMECPKGK
jgi:hypothetical protein